LAVYVLETRHGAANGECLALDVQLSAYDLLRMAFLAQFYDLLVSFQASLSALELKRLLSAGLRWLSRNGNTATGGRIRSRLRSSNTLRSRKIG
jgi:hypothetical protein